MRNSYKNDGIYQHGEQHLIQVCMTMSFVYCWRFNRQMTNMLINDINEYLNDDKWQHCVVCVIYTNDADVFTFANDGLRKLLIMMNWNVILKQKRLYSKTNSIYNESCKLVRIVRIK